MRNEEVNTISNIEYRILNIERRRKRHKTNTAEGQRPKAKGKYRIQLTTESCITLCFDALLPFHRTKN